MKISAYISRRASRGFTMIEIVTALAISSMAGIAMMTVFVTSSNFVAQGFSESTLLYTASIALENMTREVNHAYRLDSVVAANRYAISADKRTIEFSVPNDGGVPTRFRYRFNPAKQELYFEQGNGGNFTAVSQKVFLKNVSEFLVENQEGVLSFVLSMRIDMKRNGDKRYTMVGRALPRNL